MFEEIGFFKDYYIERKFIGSLICEKDREVFGAYGSKKEILTEDIILRKKKIKKGTEVTTILNKLCGKMIK